jgi:hypothetical protein
MYYKDLISLINTGAPELSGTAFKLLWQLIDIAMQQRSNVVTISCRELARRLSVSRDAITSAHRQLAAIFPIATRNGSDKTTFTLPLDWFEKEALTAEIRERPKLFHMLRKSATDAWKDGSEMPGNQAGKRPGYQASTACKPGIMALKPGSMWGKTRQDLQKLPGNQASTNKERARAFSIDRFSSSCTPSGLVHRIDSALRTVEILPAQQQDAEILRDELIEYRTTCHVDFQAPNGPDQVAIARILAIAPIEELCGVLRKLITARVPPGTSDMWFFTVLMQRIHGAPPKLVADRVTALKRKKPPMNETLPNFGPELLSEVAAGMRHF